MLSFLVLISVNVWKCGINRLHEDEDKGGEIWL